MSILINSTTLGNIIITLGSVFLLYYLIRKFAWDQITGTSAPTSMVPPTTAGTVYAP